MPCRIASTILITPATPAAAWVWPMFDFTDPSHSGRALRPGPARRSRSAPAPRSGRPSVVPVPCASTTSTWPAPGRALASAARITRCWDGTVRRGQPVAGAVLVHRAARRPPPGPGGRCERASDSRSTTSTPTPSPQPGAIRRLRERLAPPIRRQPPLPGELDEHAGRRHHRDPAGERQRALPGPQRLARQMQRHQRRRARRIDGHRRAFEPERVGDPAGRHAARVCRSPGSPPRPQPSRCRAARSRGK